MSAVGFHPKNTSFKALGAPHSSRAKTSKPTPLAAPNAARKSWLFEGGNTIEKGRWIIEMVVLWQFNGGLMAV